MRTMNGGIFLCSRRLDLRRVRLIICGVFLDCRGPGEHLEWNFSL